MFDNMSAISITVLGSLAMIGWSGFAIALMRTGNDFLYVLGCIIGVGLLIFYIKVYAILKRRIIYEENHNDG